EWIPGGFVPWLLPWKRVMTRQYVEDGRRRKIRVEYGMEQSGDHEPYFSVTREVRELHRSTWAHLVSGAGQEEIERHVSRLRPFLKWQLATVRGPMHYPANAAYWWDHVIGRRQLGEFDRGRIDPLEAFVDAAVIGALPDDEMPPEGTPTEEVVEWL